MTPTVHSRALQKAEELLGGRRNLAKFLQVPAAEIDKWIADQAKPPREIFLRVVDLILDETRPASGDEESQEPPPARDAAASSERHSD